MNTELLNVGDQAPNFSLPNYSGETVSLNDFKGKNIILWFFPKANTPGWITEGQGFRDEYHNFEFMNHPNDIIEDKYWCKDESGGESVHSYTLGEDDKPKKFLIY